MSELHLIVRSPLFGRVTHYAGGSWGWRGHEIRRQNASGNEGLVKMNCGGLTVMEVFVYKVLLLFVSENVTRKM